LTDFVASSKIQQPLSSVLFGSREIDRLKFSDRVRSMREQLLQVGRLTSIFEKENGSTLFTRLKMFIFDSVDTDKSVRPQWGGYRKTPFLFAATELVSHLVVLCLTIHFVFSKPDWSTLTSTPDCYAQFVTLVFFVTAGMAYEVGQMIFLKGRYLSSWNLLDSISYMLYFAWMYMLPDSRHDVASKILSYRILSVNVITNLFKLFQFLAISRRFGPLVMMMVKMVNEMVKFVTIFAMVIWGFAATLHSQFGDVLEEYASIYKSVLTLIQVSLGDVDYSIFEDIEDGGYEWGVIITTLYVVIGAILLLNLLIAILSVTPVQVDLQLRAHM